MNASDLNAFARSYAETALWSSIGNNEEPLDKKYSINDFDEKSLVQIKEDCEQFEANNTQHLATVANMCDDSRAGHNFWLNRNGHGAGFWDEYFGSDKILYDAFYCLSEASKLFRNCDLIETTNGKVSIF